MMFQSTRQHRHLILSRGGLCPPLTPRRLQGRSPCTPTKGEHRPLPLWAESRGLRREDIPAPPWLDPWGDWRRRWGR